jgi:hypothetical protein
MDTSSHPYFNIRGPLLPAKVRLFPAGEMKLLLLLNKSRVVLSLCQILLFCQVETFSFHVSVNTRHAIRFCRPLSCGRVKPISMIVDSDGSSNEGSGLVRRDVLMKSAAMSISLLFQWFGMTILKNSKAFISLYSRCFSTMNGILILRHFRSCCIAADPSNSSPC